MKTIRALAFPIPSRPGIAARHLSVLCAVFIVVANNGALFKALNERLQMASLQGGALVASIYLLLITVWCLVFFIAGHPWTLKPLLIGFIWLSATLGYFSQQLGIVFDVDMIRNMAETIRDNNRQEAFELISPALALHLTLFGLLPSLLVMWVQPAYDRPLRELGWRLACGVALLAVVGVTVWSNYKFTSFFVRENREIRVYTIPTYPIFALEKYARDFSKGKKIEFKELGQDAARHKTGERRVIGIMVVGETARADHLSLNGYGRRTNPLLESERLVNFTHVTSAGTSTAYSVPAMFSFLAPKQFTPEKAGAQSNVLDVLEQAGVNVVWIENNSSSKGVANRIKTIDLRKNPDPAAPLYSDGGYFDEALVTYLDGCLDNTPGDVLIVMHTMGSHGPTYHKRYPPSFAQFTPDCQGNSPQECEEDQVINAYDNTILYTDFVLEGLIDYLKGQAGDCDTFLLYASDHGESLGEEGIYLHGLPPFLAPEAQTHVPMLAWLSDSFATSHGLAAPAAGATIDTPLSHANLPHTLLGLLDVSTELYRKDLDLLTVVRDAEAAG
ncbi:MAG: phosphoethanolamine--lipid A transferase [Candidatus Hydrogenedentes bacterium]|nr:phosphoethanolamine--lipid A transferase [Candidatus Hydrogenedentota bacterium]